MKRFSLHLRLAAVSVAALVLPALAVAQPSGLFAAQDVLTMELEMNTRELCRGSRECDAAPAALIVLDAGGLAQRIEVRLQARGRWRNEGGNCTVPPLSVFFDAATAVGTPFEGQSILPLTTHCRASPDFYEQYVLKEYLAYRVYNLLTDKSLRVRLARITYRDTGRRGRSDERYALFTEHFESLAARQGAELWPTDEFDLRQADPAELATMELFQYWIGNTDWSAVNAHNVAHIRAADGLVTAVPYDFDFSGLVNAHYAQPPEQLRIRSVRQRLYRGLCRPEFDWSEVVANFRSQRAAVAALVAEIPGLSARQRASASTYLDEFFAIIDSPAQWQRDVVGACRPVTPAAD